MIEKSQMPHPTRFCGWLNFEIASVASDQGQGHEDTACAILWLDGHRTTSTWWQCCPFCNLRFQVAYKCHFNEPTS